MIKEKNDFVDVEFYRITELKNGEKDFNVGQIGGQIEVSEKQKEILNYIGENPKITRGELSQKLNINLSAIQKHLDKLKVEGIIKRIGKTKGYWEIIKS